MRMIVGLGNPGAEYAKHRHNVGFMLLEMLADANRASPWSSKHQGLLAEAMIGGEKCLLLKPQTYMNLSGQSAAAVARFYKLIPEQVIVLHDELDIPFNTLKVKQGGGNGGHNGLKSLDAHLGQNYWRLRIGIGHPGDKDRVSDYVLSNFSGAEKQTLERQMEAMTVHFPLLLAGKGAEFAKTCAAPLA